jgi:FAD/FMN-containing dehydrogenase
VTIPTPPPGFRGRFLLAPSDREPYAFASGILSVSPLAAADPLYAAHLQSLVRWASATGTALVPRGAGTGMPGGNVGPGVVVDLVSGFRGITDVDADRRSIGVQPGVTLAELNRRCAAAGLQLPVDPSSAQRCTLGGMLANNSSGSHSVKYGSTRRWTRALDVVLADGSPARLERGAPAGGGALAEILRAVDEALLPHREAILRDWPAVRKNSSGYALRDYLKSGDAVDLLVGSEGTLALTVGAEMALAPIPPLRGVALLEFTSLETAGAAFREILPEDPATCEMLDRTFLELVRDAGADADYPLRPGLEAILLVEMEAESSDELKASLGRIDALAHRLRSRSTSATDPEAQHRLWAVRHAASPLIAERAGGRVSMQFIEDGVVPVDRLPEYVRLLREVLARHELPAVIFGHAGDGNLHVNPLVDDARPGWREEIQEVLREVADGVARLGGTLSGEHGDGRLRAPLLETIWGPAFVELFRAVKHAFDPAGILNPGVILPLPGQRPLDALRAYP